MILLRKVLATKSTTRLPNASTNKAYVDIDADIFKMMKISRARQAGRPKKTVGALQRQANELQTDGGEILFFDENEPEEVAACTSKHQQLSVVVVGLLRFKNLLWFKKKLRL